MHQSQDRSPSTPVRMNQNKGELKYVGNDANDVLSYDGCQYMALDGVVDYENMTSRVIPIDRKKTNVKVEVLDVNIARLSFVDSDGHDENSSSSMMAGQPFLHKLLQSGCTCFPSEWLPLRVEYTVEYTVYSTLKWNITGGLAGQPFLHKLFQSGCTCFPSEWLLLRVEYTVEYTVYSTKRSPMRFKILTLIHTLIRSVCLTYPQERLQSRLTVIQTH
jgi:hypothetical protein